MSQAENDPSLDGPAPDPASPGSAESAPDRPLPDRPDHPKPELSQGAQTTTRSVKNYSVVRLLYNHNPFYLISACLFVYGLKRLFRVGDTTVLFDQGSVAYMEPWGLMASLAAVTLLMALTAVLVVRIGKVWEDARSILMVVLLMFLALSVSFDELLTVRSDREDGGNISSVILLVGLSIGFALGLSEILIRGMLIRLSWAWRIPLYAFLVLFFAYPVLLLPQVLPVSVEQIRWLIAAFPLAAGLVTLLLFPAVRQGSASVANNGTPWSWPWFPWSPFVMIACAICFRSYTLTISFDVPKAGSHYWDSAFGLYLLIPFLLSLLILLLEIGITERRIGLQNFSMIAAPCLLSLAHPEIVPWYRLPSYSAFVGQLTSSAASPVYLTLMCLAGFFGWAWFRGLRRAEAGMIAMLVLLAVVPQRAMADYIFDGEFTRAQIWPLVILAVLELIVGLSRRSSRAILTGLTAILILSGQLSRGVVTHPWQPLIMLHLVLVVVVVSGCMLHDQFATFLRSFGPWHLSLTMLTGTVMLLKEHVNPASVAGYCLVMTTFAFFLSRVLQSRGYLIVTLLHTCVGSVLGTIWGLVAFFLMRLPDGAKPVMLAAASFVFAVLISMLKSGLAERLRSLWAARGPSGL